MATSERTLPPDPTQEAARSKALAERYYHEFVDLREVRIDHDLFTTIPVDLMFRYNFVPRGSRFAPYISGGVGGGWIDSHANIRGAQGQDFTFNILSAAGISYMVNEHWKLDVGALYQHLSNGGQTDPNPSLNLFGPQMGLTYSF